MLDVARRPRHLALLALATALAVVFLLLGRWQLGVAQDHARRDALRAAAARPVVALDSLTAPRRPFPEGGSLRPVVLTGRYEPARQFLVPGRRLGSEGGYWVLTPVVVDTTGARITVLRGFVTQPSAPPPATGRVRVTGSLAPPESPVPGDLPPGRRGSVDVPALLNEWGGEVYNGFVFRTAQQPADPSGALRAVPPPVDRSDGLDARNLGYALQWVVFAGFAYYLWWRSVREDWRDEQAAAAAVERTPGAGPDPKTGDPDPTDPVPAPPTEPPPAEPPPSARPEPRPEKDLHV